jgi:DNA-binding transcriptional regulator LsrR (DeoR family)
MASDPNTQKLMYKIARAYYEYGYTQQDIGLRFGLSRIKVGRLLERARREKIVQITILEPKNSAFYELENQIEKMYGVDEVILVAPREDHKRTLRNIGQAAAELLDRIVVGDETIGLTWGGTLLAVVDSLHNNNWPGVRVVQLLGGLGSPEADMYGADLTIRMAQTFGAKARLLSAPGIVTTEEIREALLKDQQIKETLELGRNSDIALVGLGRPSPSSPVIQSGILSPQELSELEASGAVGDIGLHFMDGEGRAIENEINGRIIGLEINDYKNIKRLVGIAAGPEKYEVVKAALFGNYLDVLITDANIGKRLLGLAV